MMKFGTNISETTLVILTLIMYLIVLAMLIFTFKPTILGIKVLVRDMINKVDIKEIIYIILFKLLVTVGGGRTLIDLIYLINENFINSVMYDMMIEINEPIQYVISIFIVCMLYPIIEELIFRSIVFKRLSKRFNVHIGIIISSIVYAAVNVGNGIAGAFIFGITNCIMYLKYKNIFIPILVNFLYNLLLGITILPVFWGNVNDSLLNPKNIAISLFIGCLICIIGMVLFIKFFTKNKKYIDEYNVKLKKTI